MIRNSKLVTGKLFIFHWEPFFGVWVTKYVVEKDCKMPTSWRRMVLFVDYFCNRSTDFNERSTTWPALTGSNASICTTQYTICALTKKMVQLQGRRSPKRSLSQLVELSPPAFKPTSPSLVPRHSFRKRKCTILDASRISNGNMFRQWNRVYSISLSVAG